MAAGEKLRLCGHRSRPQRTQRQTRTGRPFSCLYRTRPAAFCPYPGGVNFGQIGSASPMWRHKHTTKRRMHLTWNFCRFALGVGVELGCFRHGNIAVRRILYNVDVIPSFQLQHLEKNTRCRPTADLLAA